MYPRPWIGSPCAGHVERFIGEREGAGRDESRERIIMGGLARARPFSTDAVLTVDDQGRIGVREQFHCLQQRRQMVEGETRGSPKLACRSEIAL